MAYSPTGAPGLQAGSILREFESCLGIVWELSGPRISFLGRQIQIQTPKAKARQAQKEDHYDLILLNFAALRSTKRQHAGETIFYKILDS